jgi:hypothetical protein
MYVRYLKINFFLKYYKMNTTINETDCDKLISQINNLRQDIINASQNDITKTEEQLQEQYEYLYTHYPVLYAKISKDTSDFSYNRIINMVCYIFKIQQGQLSQQTASEELGTELAKEYVYPVIPDFNPNNDLK